MKYTSDLKDTDQKHSDMVDSMAYMIATQQASKVDSYVLLYIKNCPKWLPEGIYKWILSKVLVLAEFRK